MKAEPRKKKSIFRHGVEERGLSVVLPRHLLTCHLTRICTVLTTALPLSGASHRWCARPSLQNAKREMRDAGGCYQLTLTLSDVG
eukprot:1998023-Rhodomonas_salina.1